MPPLLELAFGCGYAEAKDILTIHRDQLEKVAAEFLARETLDGPEFYKLAGKEMPRPKERVPPTPGAGAVAAPVHKAVGPNGR